ncbi:MAG: hypothetical protein RR614_02875, partial [Eubacterium sp.]
MSFEFGKKGYTFGLIAIICWVINTICNLLGWYGVTWFLGVAVLVLGILAIVNGKKELAADPENKKAKTGKTIGIVIIVLNIVGFVLMLLAAGLLVGLGFSAVA